MKKTATTLLIIVAVAVYSWDTYQVLRTFLGKEGGSSKGSLEAIASADFVMPAFGRPVVFEHTTRSPFDAHPVDMTAVQRVATSTGSRPAKTTSANVQAPNVTINSIMWSAQSSVAILTLPDGSSAVAKPGEALPGGFVVKKIEQSRVVITYQGKDFEVRN